MAGTGEYPATTKVLHWLTVAALATQFTIGYLLDVDGRGRGRGRGRGEGSGHGRGRGGDLDVFGDNRLLTAHVLVGVTILVLATVRLWWRRRTTLPPWAPELTPTERTLAHWTERALYVLLFAIPLSGLWLVLVSDDAVAVHVASHIAFFVVIAAHVGLVLKHQLLDRDRLLERMFWAAWRSDRPRATNHGGIRKRPRSEPCSDAESSSSPRQRELPPPRWYRC
jgi:cytochrome b561